MPPLLYPRQTAWSSWLKGAMLNQIDERLHGCARVFSQQIRSLEGDRPANCSLVLCIFVMRGGGCGRIDSRLWQCFIDCPCETDPPLTPWGDELALWKFWCLINWDVKKKIRRQIGNQTLCFKSMEITWRNWFQSCLAKIISDEELEAREAPVRTLCSHTHT